VARWGRFGDFGGRLIIIDTFGSWQRPPHRPRPSIAHDHTRPIRGRYIHQLHASRPHEGLRPTVRFTAGAADKPASDNFDTAHHHQGHQIYRPGASLSAKPQPNHSQTEPPAPTSIPIEPAEPTAQRITRFRALALLRNRAATSEKPEQ